MLPSDESAAALSPHTSPGAESLSAMSSIANAMLTISSPDRISGRGGGGTKRLREEDVVEHLAFYTGCGSGSSSGGGGGAALKRSHTLSTIRESPRNEAAEGSSSSSAGSGHVGAPPRADGHALRRSVSEGKGTPSHRHPPRPPYFGAPAAQQRAQQQGDGGRDKLARSFL
jgi:hypothetical protein